MEKIVLENGMNNKIDNWITTLHLKKTGRLIYINVNNISTIKLKYTKYDKVNLGYFLITLVNGKKIYVNKYTCIRTGLFTSCYDVNKDYELVDTFIRKNK